MAEDFLHSSDAVRTAQPLIHVQYKTFHRPLELVRGGVLPEVTVAYETYGRLAEARDNAVLICHALSGDSHVARHDRQDQPGWWDLVVGPGKPIDTDKYFVICPNVLGGCRGTTGPNSIDPRTGRPYGRDFPTVTIEDMVQVQRWLVDELGVHKGLTVVGASMGGHQVLSWASRFPDHVKGAVAIATSPRLTSQALAFDVVARNAILRDPNYLNGQYYDRGDNGPGVGLAIARMIGHITYLSREAMREKFGPDRHQPKDVPTDFEKAFSVGSYLGYQGDKFVERFDANSYLTLSMAMDLFDMGETADDVAGRLRESLAKWLVMSFSSDWLFPPDQSRQIVDGLLACGKPVSYSEIQSSCGHDAFLLENDYDRYGEQIRAFLENVHRDPLAGGADDEGADSYGDPKNIFHASRLDYDLLLDLVPPNATVLDVGCGTGGLLVRLKRAGHDRVVGVERDERAVTTCLRRGVEVIRADLNDGLSGFGDGQFDYVLLSHTLQAVRDVPRLLDDILRVGRRCVVTFPNFAYRKLRDCLARDGRAPVSEGLLRFEWYETPNIRFFSILDFQEYCRQRNIRVQRFVAMDTEAGREVTDEPNLNADMAIFVISR